MTSQNSPSTAQVQRWLLAELANELRMDESRIRIDVPILSYGIDSMQLVGMIVRLEDWLGRRFPSNPLEDHPTIEALASFVSDTAGEMGQLN